MPAALMNIFYFLNSQVNMQFDMASIYVSNAFVKLQNLFKKINK